MTGIAPVPPHAGSKRGFEGVAGGEVVRKRVRLDPFLVTPCLFHFGQRYSREACPKEVPQAAVPIRRGAFSELSSVYEEKVRRFDEWLKEFEVERIVDIEEVVVLKQPRIIAEMAITPPGQLDLGVIQFFLEQELNTGREPLHHELHVRRVLRRFLEDRALQAQLVSIQVPCRENEAARKLIRLTLGLNRTSNVTLQHVRQAALSAMLTRLRQARIGTCDVTSKAIYIQDNFPELLLRDLTQLLEKGFLTRKLRSNKVRNPLLPHLAPGKTLKHLRARSSELPTLVKMAEYLGIEQSPCAVEAVRRSLLEKKKLTVEAIIDALVAGWIDGDEVIKGEKKREALLFFAAQSTNPLLRGWEYALPPPIAKEGFDDDSDEGLWPVVDCLKEGVMRSWREKHPEMVRTIVDILQKKVAEARVYLFDPVAVRTPKALGGKREHARCLGSGFVLYDRGSRDHPLEWQRVENAVDFVTLITRCLKKAKTTALRELEASEEVIEGLFSACHDYVKTQRFLLDLLKTEESHWLSERLPAPDDLEEFLEESSFLPWRFESATTFDLWDYFKIPSGRRIRFYRRFSGTARDLLVRVIRHEKRSAPELQKVYKSGISAGFELLHCPRHHLNLALGHPKVVAGWTSELDPYTWVKRHVIEPGVKIARSVPSRDIRRQIVNDCRDSFPQNFGDAKKDSHEFYHRAIGLPSHLSYQQLRRELLDLLYQAADIRSAKVKAELAHALDILIFENLPERDRKTLFDLAVPVADTNWSRGQHDVLFGVTVNPGTGKAGLWQMDEGGGLKLAEDKWLQGSWWFPRRCEHSPLTPEKIVTRRLI